MDARFMGLLLSWLERTPDKREVDGSSPFKPIYPVTLSVTWGYSSVGRAPALQAGGQEFESPYLHLIIQKALNYQMEKTLGIYSQKSFSFDKRIFFEYP